LFEIEFKKGINIQVLTNRDCGAA